MPPPLVFSLQVGDTAAAALALSPPVPCSISTATTSLSPSSSLPLFPNQTLHSPLPFLALSSFATEFVAVLGDSLVVRNPPVRLTPGLQRSSRAVVSNSSNRTRRNVCSVAHAKPAPFYASSHQIPSPIVLKRIKQVLHGSCIFYLVLLVVCHDSLNSHCVFGGA